MESEGAFYVLLGLGMIYAIIHFIIVQYKRNYELRSTYEKFITNAGVVSLALLFIGLMMGSNN